VKKIINPRGLGNVGTSTPHNPIGLQGQGCYRGVRIVEVEMRGKVRNEVMGGYVEGIGTIQRLRSRWEVNVELKEDWVRRLHTAIWARMGPSIYF
jgi:hypothetical protein